MYRMIFVSISIASVLGVLYAEEASKVTYVDKGKVAEVFVKGGSLAKGSDFTASGARRTGPGQVEVHVKETDIFYVTDGAATFVTGGKMIGGKEARADQFL